MIAVTTFGTELVAELNYSIDRGNCLARGSPQSALPTNIGNLVAINPDRRDTDFAPTTADPSRLPGRIDRRAASCHPHPAVDGAWLPGRSPARPDQRYRPGRHDGPTTSDKENACRSGADTTRRRTRRLDRRITAGLYTLAIAAATLALVPTSAEAARTAAAVTKQATRAATPAAHAAAVSPNAVPGPPAGFTTTWSDDFTGAAGTGLNTGTWKYDTGPGSAASAPARSRR